MSIPNRNLHRSPPSTGIVNSKVMEVDGVGPVSFRRSRKARRIIIYVNIQQGVHVSVPADRPLHQAAAFVESRKVWIQRQLHRMERNKRTTIQIPEFSGEGERVQARQILRERLDTLAKKYDFFYNKIYIRNQRTRWGSCSSKNNIGLNSKLVHLPEKLIEYVLLHELVHLRCRNHGKNFWKELEGLLPDARSRAAELKRYAL
jgi:predicted metal-dependent hydrolase